MKFNVTMKRNDENFSLKIKLENIGEDIILCKKDILQYIIEGIEFMYNLEIELRGEFRPFKCWRFPGPILSSELKYISQDKMCNERDLINFISALKSEIN